MAFKEQLDTSSASCISLGGFNRATKSDNPVQVEGYYLGSKTVTNKLGDSKLHFLKTSEGLIGVWGKTDLDRRFGDVIAGQMVRVLYTGTRPTPRGKDMYVYKILVDADNVLPADEIPSFATQKALEEFDDNSEDDVPNDFSEEPAYTPPASAAVPAQVASTAQRANVAALLNKAKQRA